MRIHELHREVTLGSPIEEVFSFFAAAENLEELTPPWLRFRILTPLPVRMAEGTVIDYRLTVHGLPLSWRSEITVWEPPHRFVDEQRRGPYRLWVHDHRFERLDHHTRVTDHVWYAVWGGWLIQRVFVARDLQAIFDYRTEQLTTRFEKRGQ